MSFCRKRLWSLAFWCLLCVQEWLCPSVETVVVTLQNSSVFHSTGFANWTKARNFVPFFFTNAGMRISDFDFATLDVGTHEDCCLSSLFWQSLVDLKQFLNTKIQARSGNFRSRNSKMTTFFHQNFVTTGWSVFLYIHISQFPYGWLSSIPNWSFRRANSDPKIS